MRKSRRALALLPLVIAGLPAAEASAAAPELLVAPEVTGTAREGRILYAQEGWWQNTAATGGVTRAVQWLRCDASGAACEELAGATTAHRTLGAADVGTTLRVRETATNADGSTSHTSAATQPVEDVPAPVNLSPPTISGHPVVGNLVEGGYGVWEDEDELGWPTKWQRCEADGTSCVDVVTDGRSTYELGPADSGKTIRFVVMAHRESIETTTATSAAFGPVAEPVAPVAAAPPELFSMSVWVRGEWVWTNDGGWGNGAGPLTHTYQWLRCDAFGAACADIPGATEYGYELTAGDVGHTLRTRVTAANAQGGDIATSAPSELVTEPEAPAVLSPPQLWGTFEVDQSVGVGDFGSWGARTGPLDYFAQWERCDQSGASCQDVPGADQWSYIVSAGDSGHTLRLRVRVRNIAGAEAAAATPASPVVP